VFGGRTGLKSDRAAGRDAEVVKAASHEHGAVRKAVFVIAMDGRNDPASLDAADGVLDPDPNLGEGGVGGLGPGVQLSAARPFEGDCNVRARRGVALKAAVAEEHAALGPLDLGFVGERLVVSAPADRVSEPEHLAGAQFHDHHVLDRVPLLFAAIPLLLRGCRLGPADWALGAVEQEA